MPLAACDAAVLNVIPSAVVQPGEQVIATGKTRAGGVDLAGARISFTSEMPVSAWAQVIAVPELVDDWQPKELGIRRSERVDDKHIFQQMDLTLLLGAVRIRRQAVAAIVPVERTPTRFRNCWWIVDPEPFKPAVAAWADDSTWNLNGIGGWDIQGLPDGGSWVSYQFWAEAKLVPPQVQAWAMSRTLPEVARAFDARVRSLHGD